MKVHAESHLDHNINPAQLEHLCALFANRNAFFVETVELPEHLGTVPCALQLDVPESEVRYEKRGDRAWTSRLCLREPRNVREVTVVAGPIEGETEIVIYTVYGGSCAPQEPGDPGCRDVEASKLFWARAALSAPQEHE